MKVLASVLLGAALGWGYWRFVGCRSGSCPITGNPVIATLWGAAMGFMISRP